MSREAALVAAWRRATHATTPLDAPLDAAERRRIVAAAQRLSAGLTGDRELAGARYLDDADLLGAYLLLYWPVSYAQGLAVLGELEHPVGRVLDVGAGAAPLGIAALDRGATSVLAVDRSPTALAIAATVAALETATWTHPLPLPSGPFDTITVGHLLNELGDPSPLLDALLARLSPGGSLVIVEPALRETSRRLLALRDRAVAARVAVRAPCYFRGPCPALVRASDWCHAERTVTPSPLVAELAELARLHRDAVKFSYLILAPPGEAWPPAPMDVWRVVSEPLPEKGKLRYFGCGPTGRTPLVQAHKHRDHQPAFTDLQRGDVVVVTNLTPRGDGLALGQSSTVELLALAGNPAPRRI